MVALSKKVQQRPTNWVLPLVFNMIEPSGGAHQRQAIPDTGHRDVVSVGRTAKRDFLVSQAVLPTCDLLLGDRPDKSDSLTGISLDQPLGIAAVSKGNPDSVQPGGQSRIRDGPPLPYCRDDVVLADDTLTVANKVFEEIKRLRFKGNEFAAMAQFTADDVQIEILKLIPQAKSPGKATK